MAHDHTKPLSGITVLSIEQATTLPFMTYRLACDGARVIRVENPHAPDPNRFIGRDLLNDRALCSYFLPNNVGKEAITLDLSLSEGQSILHELITSLPVDIFASNLRPRSYAKLGIDYETLSGLKPDLIWLGTSGFGPDHDEVAYDPIIQARSGLMDITGEPDGDPTVIGLPIVDLGAAEHACAEVLKALYWRQKSGEGSRIDISMFHSALSWMVNPVMMTASLDEPVTRRGNRHQFFAPVNLYATQDGYIYISIGNDRQWQALTHLPGFETLDCPEYATNAGRVADLDIFDAKVAAAMCQKTSAELVAACNQIGVAASKVNGLPDVLADPMITERLVRITDPRTGFEVALPPSAALAGPSPDMAFPPRLGEHNESIYGGILRFSTARLADLESRGII
jgi:formyl-CoA transferase